MSYLAQYCFWLESPLERTAEESQEVHGLAPGHLSPKPFSVQLPSAQQCVGQFTADGYLRVPHSKSNPLHLFWNSSLSIVIMRCMRVDLAQAKRCAVDLSTLRTDQVSRSAPEVER